MNNVCIIGLGYVGLTLAVYLAKNDKSVFGVDVSPSVLNSLINKQAHFYEQGFDATLAEVLEKGKFTFGEKVPNCIGPMVYIITVGTPLNSENKTSLIAIETVSKNIAKSLKDNDLVILRSTVKIGITREVVKPILDQTGARYYLAFCPERTLEGCAFEELANLPQIIGGIDEASLLAATNFFRPVCKEIVPVNSTDEAEMVKLLNNSERDLMFALANEIALMCDAKGLNAHRIINAANYKYPRTQLKKPGPVGGPCLEKDPYILTESFENSSYLPSILMAGRKVNESLIHYSLDRARLLLNKTLKGQLPRKIAILGFAFKGTPPTSDMRGSLVMAIINYLKHHYPSALLVGHDYLVAPEEITASGVQTVGSFKEAIENAELIVLHNNHPSYKDEPWESLIGNGLIFDFWNQLKNTGLSESANYYYLGSGHE